MGCRDEQSGASAAARRGTVVRGARPRPGVRRRTGPDADRRACGAAPGARRRPAATRARRGLVSRGHGSRPGHSRTPTSFATSRLVSRQAHRSACAATSSIAAWCSRARCSSVRRCAPAPRSSLSSRTAAVRARRRPGSSRCGFARPTSHGEPVLDFWRCPMIPLRDPSARPATPMTSRDIPQTLDPAKVTPHYPPAGGLTACAPRYPVRTTSELEPGQTFVVEAGETVTGAPELARLTLNVATAHTDATGSTHGRRLVYGGHTISVAAAHATRAIPAIATIVAWHGCEHLGPVFEGDVLRTELTRRGLRAGGTRWTPRAGERRAARRRRRGRCSTGASWRWWPRCPASSTACGSSRGLPLSPRRWVG